MTYQLHTRAGLAPPFSSTSRRMLNTGSGGGGSGSGAIADGFTGTQVVIELETQLGVFNTAQSTSFNYLLHTNITNTSGNTYAGIHWLSTGEIRCSAGGLSSNRIITSPGQYSAGDIIKIRWELTFPGSTGTQTLFINDVEVATGVAHNGAFTSSVTRFALNSVSSSSHSSTQDENFTDQYIRRFYINYIDGGYEREWNFDQSTGFEVQNSANATVDPLKLFGGSNVNSVGDNWPEDNSQWVFYDDGAGSTEQDIAVNTAIQPISAAAVSLSTNQVLNLVPAQHLVTSAPVNIAQAQGVLVQTANQVAQSTAIAVQAEQQLSTWLGRQLTVAVPANIQLSQELSVLTGQESVTAQLVTIDQSGTTDVTVNPASQVAVSAPVILSLNQQVFTLAGIQVTNAQAIEIGSGKPAMVIEVLQGEQLTTSGFVTVQMAQNAAAIAAQQLVSASAVPLSQSLTLTLPEAQQRTLAARIIWGDKVIDPCKVRLTRKRSDFVLLKAENTFILNRQRQDFILRSKCNV